MRTLAHLSDLHFGRIDALVVAELGATLRALAPDLVVISGDLTQRARPAQFRDAAAFIAGLGCPVLAVPGNHDVPLHNPFARFLWPFRHYCQHLGPTLEPEHADAEWLVLGLNSARSLTVSGGRLSAGQVHRAVARLRAATPGQVRILVTHHPFDCPSGRAAPAMLIGRGDAAFPQLVDDGGVDVFLAGHLHRTAHGFAGPRHSARRSALLVQAGTATSTRTRDEGNGFNWLRIEHGHIEVVHLEHRDGAFAPVLTRRFRRTPAGWVTVAD